MEQSGDYTAVKCTDFGFNAQSAPPNVLKFHMGGVCFSFAAVIAMFVVSRQLTSVPK